ncbi:MAG TPA: hypothetical protein PKY58_04795 [Syntrophales bacterium]|nr:hypothetical protein [Syntrophales bacterium]HQN78004.1 hypothetical protein [Syntrophales bacterium]HQQ26824.1 hypothetical protein [Syntrophales bacterium]
MEERKPLGFQELKRIFEQGPDVLTFYSDFTQVVNTGHEVVFQFYETVPGLPGSDGVIQSVHCRLRASITVSKSLASNLGKNLLTKVNIESPDKDTPK